jgi:3-keto-L-gulonate-6-phosphate decarboxylase
MTEIILAGLIGVLLGVGGAKALETKTPVQDTTATKQQEVIKQLTDLDVIKELCNPEQTQTQEGLLLCREMTCFVYSRGIDSQTSGKQCEEISNIQNTMSMIEYCNEQGEGSLCSDLFWRRK